MGTLQRMRVSFLTTLTPLVAGSTVLTALLAIFAVYQNARSLGLNAVQDDAQVLFPVQSHLAESLKSKLSVYTKLLQVSDTIAPDSDDILLLKNGDKQIVWDQYGARSDDETIKRIAAFHNPTSPGEPQLRWLTIDDSLWLSGSVLRNDKSVLIVMQQLDEFLPQQLQQFGKAEVYLLTPTKTAISSTWRSTNNLEVPPLGDFINGIEGLAPPMMNTGFKTILVPNYRGYSVGGKVYHAGEDEIPVFFAILPITDLETNKVIAYGVWALPGDLFLRGPKWLFLVAFVLCTTVVVLSTTIITRVTNRQLGSLKQLKDKTNALVDSFQEDLPTEARYGPITDQGSSEVTGILKAVGRLQEVVEQRNKLESELHQAQKMESIGRLAGGIAHDFNNLLTVIVANCEVLLVDADSSTKPLITEVLRAGRRAENLTRQLLAFSRRQVLDMQNVDLNQAVGEIDDLLRRLVGARMRFSIGIQPDLGLVYADAGQLHQVIMNLCVNARDATPNGGKIELSITNLTLKPGQLTGRPPDAEDLAPGDYVRIAVTDNGAGIPEEVKGRIFEPFFSTKSVNEGTGLGLSVVKGIVEQSAGLITVNSVLAQGTTFAIYLPRVIGVAGNTADSAPKPIPQGTGTILLVEDEDLVRSAIARVLKRAGYTILVASSPSDAMAICTTQGSDIDLILTDVVMPEMTGIEMIETIRKTHPAIGTIFMSGYPGDEIARDGSFDEHGMLLQKPVNPQELISYIQSILDGPPTDKINDKNKRTT